MAPKCRLLPLSTDRGAVGKIQEKVPLARAKGDRCEPDSHVGRPGRGRSWGVLGLVAMLVFPAAVGDTAGSVTMKPPVESVLPDYDGESAIPVTEDHLAMPSLRYGLAPSVPQVSAKAGRAGSGSITVSWGQAWLGWGRFAGFSVIASPGDKTHAAAAAARSTTFSGLSAGTYTFTVIAQGFYLAVSGASAAVRLMPAPVVKSRCIYLISVNLTTQSMVASHCGVVFIRSLITSGRPGFRSPVGTFYTATKSRNITFHSPYPVPGTRGYYPPTFVKYAIQFYGLYFLHTWPEPTSAFGVGSQNGPYASLGCIQMPDAVMAALYSWAPRGTSVYIHY